MADAFDALQRGLFFAILGGISLFFLWIIRDFAFPLFWAVVLAILLHPLFEYLNKKLRRKSLSALVVLLLSIVVVALPLYGLGALVATEAVSAYQYVSAYGISYEKTIGAIPRSNELMAYVGIDRAAVEAWLNSTAGSASAWIASEALTFGKATLGTIVKFLLALYLLFHLLRDGSLLVRHLRHLLPLGDEKEELLFSRFTSATRAILKGSVIVALLQGLAGGILFFAVGIPNPALWGALMAFLALIPALGTALVWLPAGLILLATGAIAQGVIVLLVGALVIGLIDNVLRPVLVGRDTQMPDALVLLSILGGVTAFGITGIIIGPVVAALFLAAWSLFTKEYETELLSRG